MNITGALARAKVGLVRFVACGIALLLGAFALAQRVQSPQPPAGRFAGVLTIDGAIGPATADYVTRGLNRAHEQGATAVVLRIDTPGGLDTSMREIIRVILASPLPVLSYVAPSGARAASAGTYIVYASHVAAMAPGTNIGAATPVALTGGGGDRDPFGRPDDGNGRRDGGRNEDATNDGAKDDGAKNSGTRRDGAKSDRGKNDSANKRTPSGDAARDRPRGRNASEAKAINDAVAYLRSLAEMRGRNADWAERAVREAASLSATGARDAGVIDLVAGSIDEMLKAANGRQVRLAAGVVTLDTAGLVLRPLDPDWRSRFLSVIGNPNLALILLMVGFYGLLFEFMNPGALVPGVLGGISLLLGLYALSALPVSYAGAALLVLGLALMVAEALSPSFGILGIGGVLAFILGGSLLVDTDLPGLTLSMPLLVGVALSALGLSVLAVRLAVTSRKRRIVSGAEAMVGDTAIVVDWGQGRGHVLVTGERWQAEGPAQLDSGQRVRVRGVRGLVVEVEEPAGAPAGVPTPSH